MLLRMVFGEVAIRRSSLMLMGFNPNAPSYRGSSLSSLYRRLEKEKRRKYEQRICDVEMGCFTPLVFSTFEGMSTICNIFFKRLASLPADKKDVSYSVMMSWLRCRVSFPCYVQLLTVCEGLGHLKVTHPTYNPLIWLYQRDS